MKQLEIKIVQQVVPRSEVDEVALDDAAKDTVVELMARTTVIVVRASEESKDER